MTAPAAQALINAREELLCRCAPGGWWVGRLSGSALATATAAVAMIAVDRGAHEHLIRRALTWLSDNVNGDGGWGDSPRSASNLPTTLLVRSALAAADAEADFAPAATGCDKWLEGQIGRLTPERIADAVLDAYGADRSFAAPILAMCAISGLLGPPPEAWKLVPALPFELAALSRRLFRWLSLPVVSYALPALIAVGHLRHHHGPSTNLLVRILRRLSTPIALRKLHAIQPRGGGFLEAAPLTAFVAMSLAAAGRRDHPVTAACIRFLTASARDDGSWPIDTHLATWVTTLSVGALAVGGDIRQCIPQSQIEALRDWLLDQQFTETHPYTGACPGGWAWSPLSGAVGDGDDTAGALLALHELAPRDGRARRAAEAGVRWLAQLQNRDGGIPTFCRGWGHLPFDRSCPDITAHALAAWWTWQDKLPPKTARALRRPVDKALAYLARSQQSDGSWLPLWFGNQGAPETANPTYGTARVLAALARGGNPAAHAAMTTSGARWLLAARNADGGWGGAPTVTSSVEETALATDALALLRDRNLFAANSLDAALAGAADWLVRHTDTGKSFTATPIGLYFARLWYFEQLYPIIFTVSALGRLA